MELWGSHTEIKDANGSITDIAVTPRIDGGIREFSANLAIQHGLIEKRGDEYFLTRSGLVIVHGSDGRQPYERFKDMCPAHDFLLPVGDCKLEDIERKYAEKNGLPI